MKVFYTLGLMIVSMLTLQAQPGLEKIIVEKYYVSNTDDKAVDGDGGELPIESVTYRVFVDMLPGYIFQAAFGVPEHELKLATSTRFFNNEDRGARFPTYSRSQAENNTVLLDSWLSVGAGLRDHIGVLKSRDDGQDNLENGDGVLKNNHVEAGIPLTEQDGIIPGTSEPVTTVGFFDTDLAILDDANDGPIPSIISTHDGAWASLNGSKGPDEDENIVLIGQFTTDGVFEFEINLQIRNEQTLGVETYVARDPGKDETLFEGLVHIDSLGLMSAVEDEFIWPSGSVKLYPIPASDEINLEIDHSIEIDGGQDMYVMQSADGRLLAKGRLAGSKTSIDVQPMPNGMYTVLLWVDGAYVFAEKVIVAH